MKKPLLLLSFALLLFAFKTIQTEEIIGTWKLDKVKTEKGVLFPTAKFKLTITKNQIKFNAPLNQCQSELLITSDSLLFDGASCTKICCDTREDTTANFLNYRGAYSFNADTLIIQNENKYYLLKSE